MAHIPHHQPETESSGPPIRFLVTAGPTWEPIDAVRFLGNRSSGRMGGELAGAVARLGHPVTLLLGPGTIQPEPHPRLEVHRFQSAADLDRELRDRWPDHDLLVMAAAVADYRPARPVPGGKIRRTSSELSLELEAVPDLLAGLAGIDHPGTRVGFALEPRADLPTSARAKLERKSLHAIVANPLETMESDRIEGVLATSSTEFVSPPTSSMTKRGFAEWVVPHLITLHRGRTIDRDVR